MNPINASRPSPSILKKIVLSKRIVTAKESPVLSFDSAGAYFQDQDILDLPRTEGEDGAENLTTKPGIIKDKESVEKLCELELLSSRAIAENFWESAWTICSERFHSKNAPHAIALELRETWLRIMEAQWLDQDNAQTAFTPEILRPDEPPPRLTTESPSTHMFLLSRPLPVSMQARSDDAVGGSGEPQATVQAERKSKSISKKRSGKSKKGNKSGSKKGKKFASTKKDKSIQPSQKIKKTGGTHGVSLPNKPSPTNIAGVAGIKALVEAVVDIAEPASREIPDTCYDPASDIPDVSESKNEVNLEVLFMRQKPLLDNSDPSISRDEGYTSWELPRGHNPSEPIVFRLDSSAVTDALSAKSFKRANGVTEVHTRREQGAEDGNDLQMIPIGELGDNYSYADSDQVVDILKPLESKLLKMKAIRRQSSQLHPAQLKNKERSKGQKTTKHGRRRSISRRSSFRTRSITKIRTSSADSPQDSFDGFAVKR